MENTRHPFVPFFRNSLERFTEQEALVNGMSLSQEVDVFSVCALTWWLSLTKSQVDAEGFLEDQARASIVTCRQQAMKMMVEHTSQSLAAFVKEIQVKSCRSTLVFSHFLVGHGLSIGSQA